MTTELPDTHHSAPAAQPLALKLNEGLGVMALAVMRALADRAAAGKSTAIAHDWGFGSATLVDETGAHTHVGGDWFVDDDTAFASFVGLHSSLCVGVGLSWEGLGVMADERGELR